MDKKIFLSFVAPALLLFGAANGMKEKDTLTKPTTVEEAPISEGLKFGKIDRSAPYCAYLVKTLGVKSTALQTVPVEGAIRAMLNSGDAEKIARFAKGLSGAPLQGEPSTDFLKELGALAVDSASFEYVAQILNAMGNAIPAEDRNEIQGLIEQTAAVKAVLEGKDFTFNGVSGSYVEDAKDAKFAYVVPVADVFFGIASDGTVVFSHKELTQDAESGKKHDPKIVEQLKKLAPLFDSINKLEKEPLSDSESTME